MVYEHQQAYYQAINTSTQQSDSAPFIELMLGVILGTIERQAKVSTPQVTPKSGHYFLH